MGVLWGGEEKIDDWCWQRGVMGMEVWIFISKYIDMIICFYVWNVVFKGIQSCVWNYFLFFDVFFLWLCWGVVVLWQFG